MRETDIAIVGAGLAGSLAAAMLGRAGHAVTLIDPFERCRPDFRCEKLEEAHVDTLRRAGVLDEVLPAALRYEDIWVARLGRLAEVKPIVEYGVEYSALVNRLRSLVPRDVPFVQSKVSGLSLTPERQTLTLTNGEQISARLVIGANGVMADLMGTRREISRCHSVSIGFDVDSANWPFDALTYFGEEPAQRVAYLTLFPLPSGGRANLFVYRELNDPWIKRLRDNPGGRDCGNAARTCAIHRPVAHQWPAENPPGRSRRHRRSASARRSHWSATPSRPPARSAARAPPRRCSMPSACAMSTCRSGSRRPAWACRRSRSSTRIPQKRESDAHSFRTSIFAKRAALGQGLLWTAFRWGYYAGAQARNFLEHGELAEMPRHTRAA